MKRSSALAGLVICLLCAAGITAAVIFVDVQAVGPLGSTVGLAGINSRFHSLTGLNMFWYELTELFGYASLSAVGVFGLTGLMQLIKRKSLKKVDLEIWALAAVYVLIGGLYVAFEVIVINYRPEILDETEGLAASFPSSHTMLAVAVMGTAFCAVGKLVKGDLLRSSLRALALMTLLVMVAGRLLSGAHWLTDIIAGVFYGLCGIFLYWVICGRKKEADSESSEA